MAQFVGFGNGHDGSPAVSGTINSYATCTGTAAASSLTTALAASAGDIIMIHQSQKTGVGQWELNKVLADAGATLTLGYPLAYTYTSGAQAILVPQYTGGTLSGAVTCTAWAGSSGGVIALISNGALTISGSLTVAGKGFRGGAAGTSDRQGEGTPGVGAQSTAANGNGGGCGNPNDGPGGGGGNGAAGTNGTGSANGPGSYEGDGGTTAGAAALTTMVFGGGGGGARQDGASPTAGGPGGGIIFVCAKTITISGSLAAGGSNGVNSGSSAETGGGAAGGSVLVKAQTAVLGSSKILAAGGVGGTTGHSSAVAGNGGVGRIRCDYYSSVTGTTSPTLSSAQDTSLVSNVYTGMV